MTVSFAELVERARSLVKDERRAVLGIAGAPAAGKTTLAEQLVRAVAGAAHVPMDGFHLADAELTRLGLRDRKGAPETFDALGYAALLRRIREDHDAVVYAPGFQRDLEQPIAGAIPIFLDSRLIVSEGNYLLVDDPHWQAVRAQFDEVWYVDLDHEVRLHRLVERHVRFGKAEADAIAWATGTDERNAEVIMATRDSADLVVPAGVLDEVLGNR